MTPQEITAVTALVAVIVGPIVTLLVAKRQIKATVVSANRQAWINQLREYIADFMTNAKKCVLYGEANPAQTTAIGDHKDVLFKTMHCMNHIGLMLNLKETGHSELHQLMNELADRLQNKNFADAKKALDKVFLQSQSILKSEWERVKSGE